MNKTLSQDGTPIAYDRSGHGPALVLVTGALSTRTQAASLAAALSPDFTVYAYDRRGRGDSGDTPPYTVAREIEDLNTVITEAGGHAFVFGHSSGAVLALEAARALTSAIPKLAVHEPPVLVDNSRPPLTPEYLARLKDLVSAGKRGEAVAYYWTQALLVSAEELAQMQKAPFWPAFEAMAPTLVYDSTIVMDTMSGKPLIASRWASVITPTLVMDGSESPEFMRSGAKAFAAVLPNAQHRRFQGQSHSVANEILVPVLLDFFKS